MPAHLETCALPQHDLRKGVLNQAAYGLALFIRDCCNGDLDWRLAEADRAVGVSGTGPKIWSMILADLLLAADHGRKRWLAAGASMVAVDTLVHAWPSPHRHDRGLWVRPSLWSPGAPKAAATSAMVGRSETGTAAVSCFARPAQAVPKNR